MAQDITRGSPEGSHDSEPEPEVSYTVLGRHIPVDVSEKEIFVNTGRIRKIENLEACTKLQSLKLIAQEIRAIGGLENTLNLEELELYQNKIRVIENIAHLVNLKTLDLSFNKIRKIEGLSSLKKLESLYLSSNKISQIEGLESLTLLKRLELGSNKIREIKNIEALTNLEELWLGKNKITSMCLPSLPVLARISIQSNRLTEWHQSLIYNCPNIEELYLSHNGLCDISPAIKHLKKLRVLDLAGNKIESLASLKDSLQLEELWMNDNAVQDVKELEHLKPLTALETVYLERTPLHATLGPGYREAVLSRVPWLKQLDAVLLTETFTVVTNDDNSKTIVRRREFWRLGSGNNGPVKVKKSAKKSATERKNKPKASSNGPKNPAIGKLRKVEKLVKIQKIEKLMVSTARANNEHLVYVKDAEGKPSVSLPSHPRPKEMAMDDDDLDD